MADREKVFDALRNCVTEPKCKDCPWEDCEKFGCKRTTVPVTLLLDALNLLKEQPKPRAAHWVKMTGMMPPEFTGHFECDNCGWHGKPLMREIDFAYCPGCGAKMSIDGLHAEDCKKTPFDRMIDDYLEATGGVVNV